MQKPIIKKSKQIKISNPKEKLDSKPNSKSRVRGIMSNDKFHTIQNEPQLMQRNKSNPKLNQKSEKCLAQGSNSKIQ